MLPEGGRAGAADVRRDAPHGAVISGDAWVSDGGDPGQTSSAAVRPEQVRLEAGFARGPRHVDGAFSEGFSAAAGAPGGRCVYSDAGQRMRSGAFSGPSSAAAQR